MNDFYHGLLEELRRVAYRELFVATWGCWDEERHLRHFAECWERGDIYVIEVEGARVGMAQLLDHADSIEIGEIQIQPAHQGRGIGSRVLRDTMAGAQVLGKKVSLSTGLQNHRAVSLYERLGFRRVAESETHIHMAYEP